MGQWLRSFVIGAAIAACAIALSSMALHASAETTYVDGDWYIGANTTLSNGTWWVDGNVTVGSGTLRLEGAELVINTTGARELRVNSTARIVGKDSVLRCAREWFHVELKGDGEFHNCTFIQLGERGGGAGIKSTLGSLILEGCTLRTGNTLLSSSTSLQVRACRFEGFHGDGIEWRSSRTSSIDKNVAIEDSIFDGHDNSCIIRLTGPESVDIDWVVRVAGCTFSTPGSSVSVQGFGDYGHLTIENNTVREGSCGLHVRNAGGAVALRGNHWVGSINSAGLFISLAGSGVPSISNETIKGELCIVGGSQPIELRNIAVKNWGIAVLCSAAHVDILDSTISSPDWEFYSENGALIHITGCTHSHSAKVQEGTAGEVRELAPLDVGSVSWQEGTPIWGGSIAFFDPTGMFVGGLEFPVPRRTMLTSWLVTHNATFEPEVARVHYDNGWWAHFLGCNVTIGASGPVDLVVYDDHAPDIYIVSPGPNTVLGTSTFVVEGEVWEHGAGMGTVSLRLDTGEWMPAGFIQGWSWSTTLVGVPDGVHTMDVVATDRAGNSNTYSVWNVTVDTRRPFIQIIEPSPYVGTVAAWLVGRTEVGATVTVDESPVPVDGLGLFRLWVGLLDGPNEFDVYAVDRAGNFNMTTYTVVLDAVPPRITILGPLDGSWIWSSTVTVTGRTDEAATVTVNGAQASVHDLTFIADVAGAEGPCSIEVVAVDMALNSASASIVVHIDQTAPSIDIASPADGLVTREPRVTVVGRARDVGAVTLSVQGEPVDVQGGSWRATVDLTDGWNVITVVAGDAAGNTASRTFRVLLDRTPPNLRASIPLGPNIVTDQRGELATVLGTAYMSVAVDEWGTLRVTGMDPVELHGVDATVPVDLAPGRNLIVVNFTDAAGNCAREVRLSIVRDVVPPEIRLESPRNGSVVAQSWVDVAGTTEAGARLKVDWDVTTVGADGAFRVRVSLAPGWNTINVTAADMFGNSANTTVRVERREEGPNPMRTGTGGGTTAAMALLIAVLVILVVLLSRTRGRGRHARRQTGEGPSAGSDEGPGGPGVRVRRGR